MQDLRVTLKQRGFVWNETKRAYEKLAPLAARPCSLEPQPHVVPQPLATAPVQSEGPRRRVLCFTAYRTRLVDPDNNCFKWECDALRYAGILIDDTAAHVEIVTKQVKVRHRKDEGVEIVIG
jgi:hypothetical protein